MSVLLCSDPPGSALAEFLKKYGIELEWVADSQPIPGSHFGDPEAGLIDNTLLVRGDTPLHSTLHETCHYICMDGQRRHNLHTDAGGGYDEENGVCYLQILLADHLPGFGRERMFRDMDEWGYSFRLGSSRAWFGRDAEDAREWLMKYHLINKNDRPTWKLRK